MTKNQRLAVLFGKMIAVSAMCLLVLIAGSTTAYAATAYDLYIGSTQVTSDNASDIFGDGTASYDASTKTLTLNGVHIEADSYHEAENWEFVNVKCSMYSGESAVTNLVINGENSFTGEYGIFFSLVDDNDLRITGTGTLISTVVAPLDGTVNQGTAMTVNGAQSLYIGKEEHSVTPVGNTFLYTPISCTGPRLELTGLAAGAELFCSYLTMQGGTVIAEATNTDANGSLGIYLPDSGCFFNAGTIAAKGKYSEINEDNSGAFHYSGSEKFDDQAGLAFGMQCVYPEGRGSSDNPLGYIDGWAVVGMTADEFKGQTDAVLAELNLGGSGGGSGTDPVNPDGPGGGTGGEEGGGTGEGSGNSYHTDILPDSNVSIDVQAFTMDATIYSVDVEWGAMTFEYEASTWDPGQHKSVDGDGWVVYDTANEKVLGKVQDAINRVTITNHSNAVVYAKLSYAGANDTTDYSSIGGTFTDTDSENPVKNVKATWDETNQYFTLQTAATNASDSAVTDGGAGAAAVGNVYFMPDDTNMDESLKEGNGITKWTTIGKITVTISAEAEATP